MTDLSSQKNIPQPTVRSGWRWRALLLACVLSLSAGGCWLLASTSGLRWVTAMAAQASAGRVSFEGVNGTLLGPMDAKAFIFNSSDLRITARDVRLDWRPEALLSGRLEIIALVARDIEILSLPSPFPEDLSLPLPLSVHKLDIGALRVFSKEGGEPDFAADNLAAKLESDGRQHRLQSLRASLEYGQLTASGQMDGSRPFALKAQADLTGLTQFTGTGAKEAHISAAVGGNLMQITINATGSGAGLTGQGDAQLTPYAAFPLAALKLQVSGFDPRAFSPQAPKADLALQTDLRSNADGRLEGNVTANNASPAPVDLGGLPLLEARAHAALSADLLQLDDLTLTLPKGASISGRFAWQRERATGSADLAINRVDPATLDTRLRAARLNGSMKISGDETIQQGVLAISDGLLHLDARLNRAGDTVTLESLHLTRKQAVLTGHGKMNLGGQRAYSFNGKLQRFDLAAFLRGPRTDLNASLDLTGELEPQLSGAVHFQIGDSRLADQHVTGSGRIEFVGINKIKGDAELRVGDNRLSAKGSFGAATDRLLLELAAPSLTQFGPGFGGTLNAHASLAGSLAQPDLTLEAEGRNLSLPGEHHLASLTAAASLHREALTLSINAADYRSKDKARLQSLRLGVQGSRSQHQLDAEAHLDKNSKLALRVNGGLSDPAKGWANIQWHGMLTALSGEGALPFKLQAPASFTLSRDHVVLNAAEFAMAGGQVHINSAAWTPQRWNSSGRFIGIGLRVGAGLRPDFSATDSRDVLRLGGEWDIVSAAQLTGSLRVVRERGDWVLPGDPPLPLGLQKLQFAAHTTDGRLTGELTASGVRLGDLHAGLTLPLAQSDTGWTVLADAPLTGQMRINVPDLAWVGPAIAGNLKSDGRLVLEADVAGTFAAPRLHGNVRGDDLALAFLDHGVRLQQGKLAARFDQESVHIDMLSFNAPHQPQLRDSLLSGLKLAQEPGTLTVTGNLGLAGESGNVDISASRLPLAQRPDRWIIASGRGSVRLDKNTLSLGGRIVADAGLINQPDMDRPQLPGDIVFVGQEKTARKGPRIAVDATLDLGEHFYLRASGLEARLAGQLSVRDAGQQLRVTGTIAARDASYEAYGQRLTVERGIVNFQGPFYDPGLNILALRKGLSVEAGVEVTGTALHPAVRLVSTPVVPDDEKLSWIVLGRAPDASGMDSSLLLAAAGSILGSGSGGVTGHLKQSLGVDELSLRQAENGKSKNGDIADDNPLSSQIITVGKRLSARAFISYEQGVTAVAGVTKLTYTLTPRVNIVTQAGVDNAIDVFYTFSFD